MLKSHYDAVVIGSGHNGLVAACYLGMAGKSVLVIERNDYLGGATTSQRVFPDYDANLSRYSYLVSLLPQKIIADLGLDIQLKRRQTASYTPYSTGNKIDSLLLSNVSENDNQQQIKKLGAKEYDGLRAIYTKQQLFAKKIWDSFLQPLQPKSYYQKLFQTADEKEVWQYLTEKPIGHFIEDHLHSDVLRGLVLTDAKIGVVSHAHDESLLQNRTYLYHVVGNKTGEWQVPVGGMGAVAGALLQKAAQNNVEFMTNAEFVSLHAGSPNHSVAFKHNGEVREVSAKYVLKNAALLPADHAPSRSDEGSVFKVNMLLKRLPKLRDSQVDAEQAFAGTFHINESYSQLAQSYHETLSGKLPTHFPCEIYCHTLTDPSILSIDLAQRGFHTLTLFGLDAPYSLFTKNHADTKAAYLKGYLAALNGFLAEPIETCLATDRHGKPCIEAKSPLDLETELGLPQGNIFHNQLSWFWNENPATKAPLWGVETDQERVYLAGSTATRGGAVSGIAGYAAAQKILGLAT